MPTLNISDESMAKVEEIIEQAEFSPSKKEIADRAIKQLHAEKVHDKEDN